MDSESDCEGDGRRELGEQTRQRLLEATRSLVAERGQDAVTLRSITERANANVSAVSYHFGSKDLLVRTAVEQAVRLVLTEQATGLRALPNPPSLEQIARAFAAPVIDSVTSSYPQDRVLLRIAARTIDPHRAEDEWLEALKAKTNGDLVKSLRRALPDVPRKELAFRAECAVAILIFLASMDDAEAERVSTAQLEAMTIPVIAGALGGTATR
jgi:AcrR family transcriptional regulator